MSRPTLRCAVYTRKSSDEGLEQSFNSLHAQREAGEAYITSQASEGWKMIPTRYDDGGYSGGTMERPGLRQLLCDIEAGLIDVVVVYKIDRLTRSLADFARIVERFDARGVSFVSVTQAFNTTSSMGRLTLNVLLSFAQFEREVTGERIRDKIAASKAKGMWMGGIPPLGYDLPAPGSRTLQVNEAEAVTVRMIFTRYLELGSVHHLQRQLTEDGVVSKRRTTESGKVVGGAPFSRGALFHLLRNPVYRGMITHKSVQHEGAHAAIVERDLFDAVGFRLDAQARRHQASTERQVMLAPLAGKIFDAAGEAMSPTFSRGRNGRIYRYYVSASLQQGGKAPDDGVVRRISAPTIETLLTATLTRCVPRCDGALRLLGSVRLRANSVDLVLPVEHRSDVAEHLDPVESIEPGASRKTFVLRIAVAMPLRGGRRTMLAGRRNEPRPDATLVAALRNAHKMLGRDRSGHPAISTSPVSPYDRRLLRLAFLAPNLQREILAGRQPAKLNLEALMKAEIPLAWSAQRQALGWPVAV